MGDATAGYDRMSEMNRVKMENELLKKTLTELGRKNAELESAVDHLRASLFVDEETKLYTEEYFNRRLDEEIRRAQRHRQFLTLLLIDAENYPERLPFLASTLRGALRDIDIVSRFKNNRIAVALLETPESDSTAVIQRLQENLKYGEKVRFSSACYPTDADGRKALMEIARLRIDLLENKLKNG